MRFLIAACFMLLAAGCNTTSSSYVAPAPSKSRLPPALPILSTSEMRDLTGAEKVLLSQQMAESLKDPSSAQFKWTKVPKQLPDGTFTYCGMINAKNSYGGYNGMSVYIGAIVVQKGKITGGSIGAISDADRRYSNIVPDMCRETGADPYGAA